MTRFFASIVLILGAALAGAGAAYYAETSETQRIIVATKQLSYGHRLQKNDLRWVEWPKESVPEGAFTAVGELLGKGDDVGPRTALRTIEAGEPLLQVKLSDLGASIPSSFGESKPLATRGELTGLAAHLRAGMRAYTVPMDDSGGGIISPGDRVDVILTKSEDGELLSKVIMQDLPVIAVDRNLGHERTSDGGSKAKIEVTGMQVQQLLLAERVGDLLLMLRGVHETVRVRRGPQQIDNPCEWLEWISPPSPYERDFEAAHRRCVQALEVPGPGERIRDLEGGILLLERLEQKRRQLEEDQRRVAEELRRLEEQSSRPDE